MIRVGIGLYGYLPTGEPTQVLKKGMSVYAKNLSRREISYGSLGYGAELSPTDLAKVKAQGVTLCRVGYADGFLRNRKNGMDGSERLTGELCMDACLRFGNGRKNVWVPIMTDAEKMASETGTISYEVLCAATRRAEYIYDND